MSCSMPDRLIIKLICAHLKEAAVAVPETAAVIGNVEQWRILSLYFFSFP